MRPGTENRSGLKRPSRWSHTRKTEIVSPALALAKYLDLKDDTERRTYWNEIKLVTRIKSFPAIVVHQFHMSSVPEVGDFDVHFLRKRADIVSLG